MSPSTNVERIGNTRRCGTVPLPSQQQTQSQQRPTQPAVHSRNSMPTTRTLPLPPAARTAVQRHSGNRTHSQRKLGLGINEQTGRLQWCPGFKCCKFFIVLPVVLLPITLVLVLLMRMDGFMLMALRLQQQDQQQPPDELTELLPATAEQLRYMRINDYDINSGDDSIEEDLLSEQLMLPYEQQQQLLQQQEALLAKRQKQKMHERVLSEEERIKRCIVSIKFGLSETLDVEERDLMKDARTSFLPQEPIMAMPRECLESLKLSAGGLEQNNPRDYEEAADFLRRRLRRTSDNSLNETLLDDVLDELAGNASETEDDADGTESIDGDNSETNSQSSKRTRNEEDEARLIEIVSGLQSFWNEEGTMTSIRQAQSNTMRSYMDANVNPCTDFYKFACGNWERMHPIPRDKAGFDTFEMLRENLDAVLKQLLESKDLDNTKRKVATLLSNNFDDEDKRDTTADIVKAAAPAQTSSVQKSELEEKTRLRRHIVSRRNVLGRILTRYKRQTSSTKRKRLISLINADESAAITTTSTTIRNARYSTTAANRNFGNRRPVVAPSEPSAQQKAKYLYQSCTNTKLLEQRGVQPLLHLIDQMGGWPVLNPNWNANQFDWLNLTAQLRRYNNDILIVQWVGPDIKNSDENVIQFDQTSLGLPTREYFLQDMNSKYLQAYQRFASEVMHKLGAPIAQAHKTANEIISFETQLAQITSPAEQRLNVTKLYKRMTLRQLKNSVPEIDWLRYLTILQQREVRDTEEVVIYAMDYMQDLVSLLSETEPRTVANYLLWRFVRHRINNVDERFEDVKQSFYHALFGREESPQRWKVCIAQVNTNMGMALGSMFVSKYFDENSKRDTLKMTHELQQAFREILKTTDWLDISTKHLAELKVNAMSLKIGYPDFILNSAELNEKYAGIEINPERYFENTLNVLLHTAKTEQNKLHEPVNKTAWQTAPAIVNAYYSRNKNQIMFPAGILQPPFYHRYFPRSLNFGGIGVVIGHELTHGFDDKGRLFDRNGSIHKWWTDTSIKGFDERARCIIAQYSNYTVGEVGITLNGESTQGENIADNGGIRQAFHAYKAWLHNNPEAARNERLPGLNMTGEQLFFLNFGQVWCGAMRPEAVRNKLNTAIHSPGRFRVIGTLSNSNDFAREFHCPVGSPMNPVQKCSVW